MSLTTPLTTQALHSTRTHVRNTSGSNHVFGYLGPNGVALASNQDYWHNGNLRSLLAAQKDQTRYFALMRDLESGYLTILREPDITLQDQVTGATHLLEVHSGQLGFADPNWLPAPSSAFVDSSA